MKPVNVMVTHCEWCGKRLEIKSYRKNPVVRDSRFLVYTDKGPLKVCKDCYQYMSIHDNLGRR